MPEFNQYVSTPLIYIVRITLSVWTGLNRYLAAEGAKNAMGGCRRLNVKRRPASGGGGGASILYSLYIN